MRYVQVKVKRDPHTSYVRDVPEWEIPILEFIFEEGNVERLENYTDVDTPWPAPKQEFERLCGVYGKDTESGIPFAASVYGQAGVGVRALGREIEAARQAADAAKPRRAASRSRRTAEVDDSLLV